MKTKFTFLLLTFLTFVGNTYSQFDANHPDLRNCGSAPNYYTDVFNCNSNNFTLRDVFLSITDVNGVPMNTTTCTIGTTQQLYVTLNYTSNASNTPNNGRLFADIAITSYSVNGTPTTNTIQINSYLGSIAPGAGQRLIYGPFSWTCGQELELNRILVVWRTGGSATQLTSYNCSTYSSSQCELPGNTVIKKPLAVQFTYKACRVGNNLTVNFTSTTNGGTAPYSYEWDFNGDNITDSTLPNPTYTYLTPTGNTAKLTVKDALNLTNTYSLPIVSPTELLLSETHTNVACGGGGTGTIDLTPSNGTPGYTYSWSNGATSEDLSGLSAGTYTVTVTDLNGCQKTLAVTISGGDSTNPIVTAPANTTIQGCGTASLATAGLLPFSSTQTTISTTDFNTAGGSYTDASAISSITYQDMQSGTCPIVITRTFRVTDACNNTGIAIQTITIQDTTAPVITGTPAPLNLTCAADVPVASIASVTATDNCAGTVTVVVNDVTTAGLCANKFTVNRTWTATDVCGNNTSSSQLITVNDTTPPSITGTPAPVTVTCAADVPVASIASVTATDNCAGTVTVVVNDVTTPGLCANKFTITRTWTATDICGNSTSSSQLITVNDTTPPSITGTPAPVTVTCAADVPVASIASVTASDNCGGIVTVIVNDVTTPGLCANKFTVTRTWTATDVCGNSTSSSQLITVNDTTPHP